MDSVYVELVIGLALAFFLLSTLISGIQEAIVRALGVRGKVLWGALHDVLDRPPGAGGAYTPQRLWEVVRLAWASGEQDPRPAFTPEPSKPLPSPQELTRRAAEAQQALRQNPGNECLQADVKVIKAHRAELKEASLTDLLYKRLSAIDHHGVGGRSRTGITQIPPAQAAAAILEIIAGRYDGSVDDLLADLKKSESPFHDPLQALWKSADGDFDKLRGGLENWFDGEMTRLTGLYRRHTRWIITAISVLLTLFVSFDAIQYASDLFEDETKRAQIATVAASGNAQDVADLCQGKDGDSAATCIASLLGNPSFEQVFRDSLVSVSPVAGTTPDLSWNEDTWWDRVSGPGHWPGFLITIVALLFGAPFWWDVLRRAMGMRTRRVTSGS